MDTTDWSVGMRVVCVDADFPELAYRTCVALPRRDGVYTIAELNPRSQHVVTKRIDLGFRLRELPQPLRDQRYGRYPHWAWWRFVRLDDPRLWRPTVAEVTGDPIEQVVLTATS